MVFQYPGTSLFIREASLGPPFSPSTRSCLPLGKILMVYSLLPAFFIASSKTAMLFRTGTYLSNSPQKASTGQLIFSKAGTGSYENCVSHVCRNLSKDLGGFV